MNTGHQIRCSRIGAKIGEEVPSADIIEGYKVMPDKDPKRARKTASGQKNILLPIERKRTPVPKQAHGQYRESA